MTGLIKPVLAEAKTGRTWRTPKHSASRCARCSVFKDLAACRTGW